MNRNLIYSISHRFFLRALIFFNALFLFCKGNLLFADNFSHINPISNNCLWVNYQSISDSSKVDSLINFINLNKINKIFIETYNNGQFIFEKEIDITRNKKLSFQDSIYKESILDTTILDTNYHYNKFYNSIQRIRENQVEVYAWIEVYRLWSRNYFPEDSLHIYYQCKECLESDINGRSDKFIQLDKIQSLNWEGVYLSPLHPEVNKKIFNKLKNIIREDIFDGFIFDYLRYQNNFFGYNHKGIEDFILQNQFDPRYLNKGIFNRILGYSKDEIDSLQIVWDDYKNSKITQFLSLFKSYIIENNLNFKIGSKVKESPELSKAYWHQDWKFWINNNIIDFVVVDNKETEFFKFVNSYKNLLKFFNYNQLNNIIINLGINEDPIIVANKILYLRLDNFSGISIDKYNYYSNNHFIDWSRPIYKMINFSLTN